MELLQKYFHECMSSDSDLPGGRSMEEVSEFQKFFGKVVYRGFTALSIVFVSDVLPDRDIWVVYWESFSTSIGKCTSDINRPHCLESVSILDDLKLRRIREIRTPRETLPESDILDDEANLFGFFSGESESLQEILYLSFFLHESGIVHEFLIEGFMQECSEVYYEGVAFSLSRTDFSRETTDALDMGDVVGTAEPVELCSHEFLYLLEYLLFRLSHSCI